MKDIKKFAVIGSPIDHSLSPMIHSLFAKKLGIPISYEAIQVERENFSSSVQGLFEDGYSGINVTLPLKEEAFKFADSLSDEALLSESVNTLWRKDDSLIYADTTDGRGLIQDFLRKKIELKGLKVLILGAGGSAKAVIPALLKKNPHSILIANRTIEKAELLLKRFSSLHNNLKAISISDEIAFQPDLIINASSAGVLGQDIEFPDNIFSKETIVYDLSYSADNTPFVDLALSKGVEKCYDGIGMLIEQAALSFEIWTHQKPDTDLKKNTLL